MSRLNSVSCRNQESPDLLSRCIEDKSLKIKYAETHNGSPVNFEDIIISDDDDDDDDDTKSLDSNATIILQSDIIVDDVQKPSPSKQDTISSASSCTPKKHQQIEKKLGLVRCKSLKELLKDDKWSPKSQVNDRSRTQSVHKRVATPGKIRKRLETSPDLLEKSNNSCLDLSSSSSSTIPPTPTPKCSKLGRRIMIPSELSNDDSNITYHNSVKIQRHSKLKELTSRPNGRKKPTNKLNNYRRVMAKWSMHEATPPTSESDCSDDDSKDKRSHELPKKTLSNNRIPSNPSISRDRERPRAKYVLNTDYVLEVIRSPITYKTRSAKSNGDKVESKPSLNNKKSLIHVPSISNVVMNEDDRLKLEEVNDRVFTNADKEYEAPRETKKSDSYRKWMQQFSKVEAAMTKQYDFPAGVKYLDWERFGMIWFLLKSKNIQRSRSRKTWAEMMEKGYLKHRSMRSLHNHFERKILPEIHNYHLPADIIKEFEAIMH